MGGWETIEVGGRAVRCHVAGTPGPGTPGVLLLHAWWGLNEDIRAYADRLAAEGFAVLAPDLYAGTVVDTVEEAERMSGSLDEAASDAIALAAFDSLARRTGPGGRTATLGFSLGVPWAVWVPARRSGAGRFRGIVCLHCECRSATRATIRDPAIGDTRQPRPQDARSGAL